MEPEKKVLVGSVPKPFVGKVEKGNEVVTPKGKMVFVSCSAPFSFEGRQVRRVTRFESDERAAKKAIMQKLGMTSGKQFRDWEKANRRKEREAAAAKAQIPVVV